MKRAGKASLVAILAIVAAVAVIVLLFFGGESATSIASRFMAALAKGDVDALAKMTVIEGKTPEQVREAWEYTVTKVAPHYRFVYRPISAVSIDPDTTNVKFEVITDAMSSDSYPEFYEIPMRKVNGEWKIDPAGIKRKMYPGLPR